MEGGNFELTFYTIPGLEEALQTAKGRIYIDLDVKNKDNLDSVAKIVQEMGMQDEVDIKTIVQNQVGSMM